MKNPNSEIQQIRILILIFIILLVLSGITAFFVETGLYYIIDFFHIKGSVGNWINYVHRTISEVNKQYPFISYGYDWLAFGHLIIALFFIGAYREPFKNNWIIVYGMVACAFIFPPHLLQVILEKFHLCGNCLTVPLDFLVCYCCL